MKKQLLTLIGVLSLLLVAGSAVAQSGEVRANVPFDFVVNHVTLPAGQYSITSMGGGDDILVIRGLNTKSAKFAPASREQAGKAADRTKLVFRCYGDRYFLSQIWIEGSHDGRMLPTSDLETEAALDATPREVVLFASLR